MLGLSKKTTRTELLRMKTTGTAKEFSDWVQKFIFDYGHEVEALARPLIEDEIGDDLYPVTCSDGRLSASCDGLNAFGTTGWEHKQWNEKLAAAVKAKELPDEFMVQPQQCLMVTGAEKWIFTVSDGTQDNKVSMEILPDPAWFERIRAGWRQFNIDRENYVHVEVLPAAVAAPTKDLPALSIQVNGSISLISNLDKFGKELNAFVGQINKEPTDDQGFADAEAAIKTLQNAQDALEAAEANALAQTSDIDDMRKTVKLYADTARTTRLMLEKMVKARKESLRIEIMQGGKDKLDEHIANLNKRLGKPYMPAIAADFAGAVKNKRTITSLRESVNNELLRCTLDSSAIADKIEINLNSLRELAKDFTFLFADTHELVLKDNDAVVAIANNRITEHKAAKAAEEEALRVKMQAEEEAKARAKVEAEAKAAQAKIDEEARLASEAEACRAVEESKAVVKQSVTTEIHVDDVELSAGSGTVYHDRFVKNKDTRPTRIQMIEAVEKAFNMQYSAAEQCMREAFAEVAA